MDDQDIIALFFARSEEAITLLAARYGAKCEKIAFGILNNRQDAEECVNDAYLGAWNTIPPQRPNPLLTYICRIVRNLAIKKYHSNTAKKRNSSYDAALSELEHVFLSSETVESEFDARETARLIDRFLEGLDRESRVLFVRRYWYAESIEELSDLFHSSRHNISVRLSRIREKLKVFLRREGVSL